MSVSEAFRQGFTDAMKKMASDRKLPEPVLQYSVADVWDDSARNWMTPEEMADYVDTYCYYAPLYENGYGSFDKKKFIADLKKRDTLGSPLDLDSRILPYKKHKVLFGLLPDSIEEDVENAVVDDSGTQRLRKFETDFLRDMYTTGKDEDRKEVKRLLRSYIFKHDLDDLINKK